MEMVGNLGDINILPPHPRFILPFFQDYEAAGDFDMIGRVKRSIKVNLTIIAGIASVGLVFIIYLVASGKISWYTLIGRCCLR